jgi:hypothetical protein
MKAGVQRKRNEKLTASVLRVHPRASVMIACPATLQRPDCIEEEVRPLAHGNMAPCFHCLTALRCIYIIVRYAYYPVTLRRFYLNCVETGQVPSARTSLQIS